MTSFKVGDKTGDGSVFFGINEKNELLFAAPADEPLKLSFNKAVARAQEKSMETGKEWQLPSAYELHLLFESRAAIGGFNSGGIYLSSSDYDTMKDQYFGIIEGPLSRHFGSGQYYPAYDKDCSIRLIHKQKPPSVSLMEKLGLKCSLR